MCIQKLEQWGYSGDADLVDILLGDITNHTGGVFYGNWSSWGGQVKNMSLTDILAELLPPRDFQA